MSKIPFDIKFRPQIESCEYKVETRNGCTARIICWDRKDNNYPIVALFEEEKSGKECLLSYTQNGQHVKGISNVSDLVIVTPEPELTEFEKALADTIGYAISQSVVEPDYETYKFVKDWSERLFSLGRKEIIKQGNIVIPVDDFNKRLCVAMEHARKEALKDLPRWKKISENGRNYSGSPQIIINGRYLEMTSIFNDVYEIALSDLEKLPKEGQTWK